MDTYKRPRSTRFGVIQYAGSPEEISGTNVTVQEADDDGAILAAFGPTVPTNGAAQYAKGAIFRKTDAAAPTSCRYENVGDDTSCQFVQTVTASPYSAVVGFSNADFICDGVADNVQIQAAIDYVYNILGGGMVYVKGSSIPYSISTAINLRNRPGVTLWGESQSSVTFKAASGLAGGTFNTGVINMKDSTIDIENVTMANFTVDANNVANVSGIVMATSLTLTEMNNVRLANIKVKNCGSGNAAGIVVAAGLSTTFSSPRGPINGLQFTNIETANNGKYGMLFDGSQMTNVLFDHMHIHDTGFSGVYLATDEKESNQNWKLIDSRFEGNMYSTLTNVQADFHDANLNGIINFEVRGNYFGPCTIPANKLDHFNLTVYNMRGCVIDSNFFEGPGTDGQAAIAIGASKAGNYYKTDANQLINITNNTFYKVRAPFDGDANYFANISGNFFYYTEYRPISNYSRHFPTTITNNFIYNCVTNPPNANDYENSGMYVRAGGGMKIYNNFIIDDRLLRDPTTAPTLTDVAGGSLGATTYYVVYTWANDTGETLVSSEASRAVAANRRLVVTPPAPVPPSTAGAPSGAKYCKIYVSTSSGAETLQATLEIPNKDDYAWTEPTTGLVSGAAMPGSNTTHALMKFGIYELDAATDSPIANDYGNNSISGMATSPIYLFNDSSTVVNNIGINPNRVYSQGNITGATTFSRINGQTVIATITGNVTTTITDGLVKGDTLTLQITQSGGGNSISKPANVKLVGGAFSPSAGAGAVDIWNLVWDGTSWNETGRSLNLS